MLGRPELNKVCYSNVMNETQLQEEEALYIIVKHLIEVKLDAPTLNIGKACRRRIVIDEDVIDCIKYIYHLHSMLSQGVMLM